MTDRFVSSGLKQKNIRFKVQIGDYSKYVCKGYYTSPEFGNGGCKWNLLVHVYDGADHMNFIDVRLQRHDHVTEEQFIDVKMSILNCFGFRVLKNERKMLFTDDARILAVAKEDLKGYCGLKKRLYLPNDTLTLQCDLVVHENNVSAYENTGSFFSNISRKNNNFSEYFAHSRLVEKATDYFDRQIRDFSVHAYAGRTVTPEYQSERFGGKWSLVVCSSNDDNLAEYFDIRVMRRETYEPQLVKIKLSIIDRSGKALLSKEKNIYFTSSREEQLLTLNGKTTPSWLGFMKKDLIPDDALTLHCEMVLYEQIDENFGRKEEFEKSIKTSGYSLAPIRLFLYLVAICFMLSLSLYIVYLLCCSILSFVWYTVLDILEAAKMFLVGVVLMALLFSYIRSRAEDIMRKKKINEIKKKEREERERIFFDQFYGNGAYNYMRNNFPYKKISKYLQFAENKLYYSKKPMHFNQKYLKY